jgi:alpha-tubulin suppressor-like RCC1 family protein
VGSNDDIYCWGNNEAQQVSSSTELSLPTPVAVGLSNVGDIGAAAYHTCALQGTDLYCWGENSSGQLGYSGAGTGTPTRVSAVAAATEVSTGAAFTCVRNGTAVQCFGTNGAGQLGNGGTMDSATPIPVPGAATDITGAHNHACMIDNMRAYCWGINNLGQIGNGRTQPIETPVAVSGAIDVYTIKGGGDKTCMIANAANTLYCWGYNGYGDLGTGDAINHDTPQMVMTGATQIALGTFFGCAVTGGPLRCWGDNAFGQLADGTMGSHNTPAPAATTAPNFTRIDMGDTFGCGLGVDSQVYCWGDNEYGQLGQGTRSGSLVPVAVALP